MSLCEVGASVHAARTACACCRCGGLGMAALHGGRCGPRHAALRMARLARARLGLLLVWRARQRLR